MGSISRRTRVLLGGVLLVFLSLQFFVPLRTAIKIGADEDWELSKAMLALKGYHFYSEVWNDQPLLHTAIIRQVLEHLSPSVLGPRLVTSGFALVLLTSVFLLCRRVSGALVATVATGLLIFSPGFLELSSSCMVEIPALAPAVAGIFLLSSRFKVQGSKLGPALEGDPPGANRKKRSTPHPGPLLDRGGEGEPLSGVLEFSRLWSQWAPIIGAGVLFGISFQIKFINVILLPLVLLIIWLRERKRPSPVCSSFKLLLLFAVSLFATFVVITFAMGAEGYWLQLKQSWAAHFAATKSFEYGSPSDHPFEWSVYLKNWDITIPAVVGIIFCLRRVRQNVLLVIPVAWFALTFVVFGIHKPWWSYYYIHNAVPLCWCAAIGVQAVINQINVRRSRAPIVVAAACALCVACWMVSRVYLQISAIRSSPKIYSSLVIKEVERYKPFTKFIYTDEPAYSFHTGIPMPPSLAVLTLKRLWSGDMTNARIVEELKSSQPGVLLLKNQTVELPYSDWIASEYRLVYQDGKHNLYAHKSIVNKPKW